MTQDFESSFAEIAVLEINVVKVVGSDFSHGAEGITEGGPAELHHFVLGRGEGRAGEPGNNGVERFRCYAAQVIGEHADLLQFAAGGSDGQRSLREGCECFGSVYCTGL